VRGGVDGKVSGRSSLSGPKALSGTGTCSTMISLFVYGIKLMKRILSQLPVLGEHAEN
jgi:hypothetical protein